MRLSVQVKVLDDRLKNGEFAMPSYGTPYSAGLDVRAMPEQDIVLAPGEVKLIPTGLSVYIASRGYVGFLMPRSGLGHKKGLVLGNLTGVIDADYQGPLMVSLWNRSYDELTVHVGDLVAQLVVVPMLQLDLNLVEEFSDTTSRGEKGFGSTGSR